MSNSFQTTDGRCEVSPQEIVLYDRPEGILPSHLARTSSAKRHLFYTGACVAAIVAAVLSAIRGDYVVTVAAGTFGLWMLHGLVTSMRSGRATVIRRESITDAAIHPPQEGEHGRVVVHFYADDLLTRVELVPADADEYERAQGLLRGVGLI